MSCQTCLNVKKLSEIWFIVTFDLCATATQELASLTSVCIRRGSVKPDAVSAEHSPTDRYRPIFRSIVERTSVGPWAKYGRHFLANRSIEGVFMWCNSSDFCAWYEYRATKSHALWVRLKHLGVVSRSHAWHPFFSRIWWSLQFGPKIRSIAQRIKVIVAIEGIFPFCLSK